ncbi:MAG TPA: GGDEF domain-containing protein [Sedimentisphaerales bacterium]|nr:GGDEF domain-containing protein [Sedimentisphaerales bacterium]HRS13059.1 GGDEF domain-containing protein [Sedimentisphaerales bacterium]HRV49667.1 GGDEF domain-containing protein [Sedimentisphaerales bacterium]
MNSTGDSPTRTAGRDKVLLVGDIRKAFLDAERVERYPCDVRMNLLEAIDAAAGGAYDAVGVVMNGLQGQLRPVLRALRKATTAPIVLLAQMYDEPVARHLVQSGPSEEKVADAYRVCPITLASFGSGLTTRSIPTAAWSQGEALMPLIEKRMRYLERLATTDDLTGLKNRRYIREFARQIIERARRSAGRVTLLVFDIDNFKHYNDDYGHATGDEILKQAAILMRRCCRPHDVVGRIGGDEFAVVFWDDPHCVAPEAASERRHAEAEHPSEPVFIARRFQSEFGHAELNLLGPEGPGVLTISGALARFPRDGTTVQELFERADAALLEAKRSGKNRIYLVGEPKNNIADLP